MTNIATSPNRTVNQDNQDGNIFHFIKPYPSNTNPTPEKILPNLTKQVTY